jgi:hypothetical protein
MQLTDFKTHDVSRFPEARCVASRIYPGYGPQWREELEALIERNVQFFMVSGDDQFVEKPEDTRLRAVRLKANKHRPSRVCKSIVSIAPHDVKREKLVAQSAPGEPRLGHPNSGKRGHLLLRPQYPGFEYPSPTGEACRRCRGTFPADGASVRATLATASSGGSC